MGYANSTTLRGPEPCQPTSLAKAKPLAILPNAHAAVTAPNSFRPFPTRQITAASPSRRGELRRFVALWIQLFWRRAWARNDESPAWRPGLSNSLGLWGEPISQIQTPPISGDRQLKNTVFESGGAWPIDSRRQKGRPSHRDGHGASIRLRLRGAPARTDPTPQPPTRAL